MTDKLVYFYEEKNKAKAVAVLRERLDEKIKGASNSDIEVALEGVWNAFDLPDRLAITIPDNSEAMIDAALLRGALARIARLAESEGAKPLDDAVQIARHALLAI